jgi:hypothetical protein
MWWCYNGYNEIALFALVYNALGGAIINNGIIALSIIALGGVCSKAES